MIIRFDHEHFQELAATLTIFDEEKRPLPGIQTQAAMETFVNQLLESLHREIYISMMKNRTWSENYANPNNDEFHPLKAAIYNHQKGNLDEAFWLVFLLTHFGKHRISGWYYVRAVYGCLGEGSLWNWVNTSINPIGFKTWLYNHQSILKPMGSPYGFGNHRRYISLDAFSQKGTGATVESYIKWIDPTLGHQNLIDRAYQQVGRDPNKVFEYLFHSMKDVVSFGRLARFDYLSMVGQLGFASIEPEFAYLKDSTGPLRGARFLFGGKKTIRIGVLQLETWLTELDGELGVGKRVLEDALCNWQKSPEIFKKFRG